MPKDLWKWGAASTLLLVLLYWLAYASAKSQATKSSRCADQLDLPDKGATLGTFSPLQAASLARECRETFGRWFSSGSASDALSVRLMALTNDQLFALNQVYNSTYEPTLVAEIENDWAYLGFDKLFSGAASQLVERLKALETGAK
jgi:hypothetical protein